MKLIITFCFVLLTLFSFAQEDAKVQKAIKIYNQDKKKGIAKMEKIVKKNSTSSNWTTLVKMYEKRYTDSKNSLENQLGYLLMKAISSSKSGVVYLPNTNQ